MPNELALADRWSAAACAGFSPEQLLLYRSNLLGADLAVTNYAGGNTSAKLPAADPLTGEPTTVLWVKGSGGDLGSMRLDGFATLHLDRVLGLRARYRGHAHEDEMVGYLQHCTYNLNPRAASIDTPLHAFIPHAHVDHMHPDAVIALAAARDGERLVREVYGEEIGWLPWLRPGFELAMRLADICKKRPGLRGVVLGGHGLFTWGATSEECYRHTLAVIRKADAFLRERAPKAVFGGAARAALEAPARRAWAVGLLPGLRGLVSREVRKLAHFDDSEETLAFVNSARMRELAALGTSCPDHFLRTKIRPLVLECDPSAQFPSSVLERAGAAVDAYRADYAAYYQRCRRPISPAMRDANPVVVLVPGVGMFTFAKDKATARVAGEFYGNAIRVMRGATAVSEYVGLAEHEAFDIEYWPLEEAKLKRMPPAKALEGRAAVVTGAAGGIGRATCERLLADGASVVALDIDEAALLATAADLVARHGKDRVRTAMADVTSEAAVRAAMERAVLEYGGVDIVVCNAGLASAAPFDETSLDLWNRNWNVLATGYFLVAREGFRVMKAQGGGGSIVFVGSKNALAASAQASAYNTAKSAELHLARCIALEGAPLGIRANVVNPDAVLRGSRIWAGAWRTERAAAYGVGEEQLEEHYRKRSLLQRNVFPEDVAEAVAFFASDLSAKSTGNILNVDAGNVTAFPR